jgi:hypothetical protein
MIPRQILSRRQWESLGREIVEAISGRLAMIFDLSNASCGTRPYAAVRRSDLSFDFNG